MSRSNFANLSSLRVSRTLPEESELLDALAMAVISTDINGYIIYWNRAAEHLYGWSAIEVTGRNILDVIPSAESRAAAVAIFDRLIKGENWSGTFETRHKEGHRLVVDVTDSPIRDQQGKLTAIIGISKLARETENAPSSSARDAPRGMMRMLTNLSVIFQKMATDGPDLPRGITIALLLYGLALGGRILLDLIIPNQLPFISFFPAIIMSAVLCGLWPTLALLLAAAVTGAMWGSANSDDFAFQIVAGSLFLVIGSVVIAQVIYANSIQRRLQRQDEQLSLVNRELKHRLKNMFAVTSSICVQTIKSDLPREVLAQVIAGRIQAVASAQDLLSATGEKGSDLRTLIEAVVTPLSPDATRLEIAGPQLSLPIEATMPFALILHELATNAVKYGAWASAQGRTVIQWRLEKERQLEFCWREEGVSIPSGPNREGFGSVLIKRALSHAKVQHQIGPQGADCIIDLAI